ncbi:TOMM precursor leader peptide-binding protein [Halobacillus sp. H74]|uniref:TOMM precursor leader peptide-binding protein n=1 Tax=Halobacillus sp. H74 TaxID=3457436 RepID=UPI003FCD2096
MKSLKKILLVGNFEFTDKFKRKMTTIAPYLEFYAVNDLSDITKEQLCNHFSIIISLYSYYDDSLELQIQQWAHFNHLSYLRIHLNMDEIIIGPYSVKDKPGCLECQIYRQDNANQLSELRDSNGYVENESSRTFVLGYQHMSLVCMFVKEELHSIARNKKLLTHNNIYRIDLKTLKSHYHSFIPNPRCNHCSELPQDRKESSILNLKSRPLEKKGDFRVTNDKLSLKILRTALLDQRQGMITSLTSYANKFLPVTIGHRAVHNSKKNDPSIGKENTFTMSETVSFLECLERVAGSYPQGKNVNVIESYERIVNEAIHPKEFGLYSQKQYSLESFTLKPFEDNEAIPWIWAYSNILKKPVLIPEDIAYFGNYERKTERFVLETSNGCALGGCMEEAILHGLFEVIERDAFLLMWYAKLSYQSVNLELIDDEYIYFLYKSIETLGYEVYVYNITTDMKIPSFAAFCVNSKLEAPYLFTSAGTHIDPFKAIKSALQEIAAHAQNAQFIYENNKDRVSLLSKDPERITNIEDHYLFYYDPINRGHLDFLLEGESEKVDINEMFNTSFKSDDITEYLNILIDRVIELGYDVIVVDQTPHLDIYKDLNLSVVKVLIPGALPPGFGTNYERVLELNRVYSYPIKAGLKNEKLNKNDLNKSPHPFA